jgi:hypothetical protein
MSDIGQWLRAEDPASQETPPSDVEMAGILRRAMREAELTPGERRPLPLHRWRLATLVAVLAASVTWWVVREKSAPVSTRAEALASVRPEPARELYFTTPDGIRVIWIFTSPASE